MYDIPAILFAGGKSSRMGTDKALLPFKNFKTLSEFQHHKLQQVFNEVYISSKENKFDFDCNIIYDIYETNSPLIALLSIFETLDSENIFILSVDTPLVDNSIFNTLHEAHNLNVDVTVAKSPKSLEPLCAIYNRSIVPQIKSVLKKDMHKLQHLLKLVNTQTVQFKDATLFTNLNYMHEYKAFTS